MTLYEFKGGTDDGSGPTGALTFDSSGHLYGVTTVGGVNTQGTIYELTPKRSGFWGENVIFNFVGYEFTGWEPTSGVIIDSLGNLYGTTPNGGTPGYGVAYELSRNISGTWNQSILHDFANGEDGRDPLASLIWDVQGNLYGTTVTTAFELSPSAGTWTFKVLSQLNVPDGGAVSALVFDAAGNLYGTTLDAGISGAGTVFELSPPSGGGSWVQNTIYTFTGGRDGGSPSIAALAIDSEGSLYGTTAYGGAYEHGTVFKLSPETGGSWTETVLHNFRSVDGAYPEGGVIIDISGNLYGTTYKGGQFDEGTVFEITP